MSDWFDYQAKKTAPKPSRKRKPPAKPTQEYTPKDNESGMKVEEADSSPSMIQRIFGKRQDW
jgi:hypothetical protein